MEKTPDKSSLDDDLRDRLYRAVYEEFVGPRDFNEEELLDVSPTLRYNAGVLHPRGSEFDLGDVVEGSDGGPEANPSLSEAPDVPASAEIVPDGSAPGNQADGDDFEEPISLSNARQQAAMSMTIAVREGDRLSFEVQAARYEAVIIEGKSYYRRIPMNFKLGYEEVELPQKAGKPKGYRLDEGKLELWVVFRRHIPGASVVTVALCNAYESDRDTPEKCYFNGAES